MLFIEGWLGLKVTILADVWMSTLKQLTFSSATSYRETAISQVHIQVCVSHGQKLSALVGKKNDIISKLVVARGLGVGNGQKGEGD